MLHIDPRPVPAPCTPPSPLSNLFSLYTSDLFFKPLRIPAPILTFFETDLPPLIFDPSSLFLSRFSPDFEKGVRSRLEKRPFVCMMSFLGRRECNSLHTSRFFPLPTSGRRSPPTHSFFVIIEFSCYLPLSPLASSATSKP